MHARLAENESKVSRVGWAAFAVSICDEQKHRRCNTGGQLFAVPSDFVINTTSIQCRPYVATE